MQAQKEAPPDMQCRDKFLLQNIIAKAGATPKDITPDELFYVQSTGSFLATARYGSATPVPPSVLSRGFGWLGFGIFIDSMCGTVTGFAASV
ncbi:hypothetical protein HanIR_Chr13g0634691 [Helianthus annuus]|nr:hypothetical protein HanIR_Chr13g0634691 [Helianthus annuus]